ncbi:MAG: 16S rRNA (guanine(966)-N(2))-methyltransferase RsmD [Deltaproteobacteria bacterium]|jgi:16S rRNA (guanine966-N2)-methyltransferase|nr:16S rRNA (guanine(966)-N(2))-methyltransferase RsmD [Deltaproteobacteria bacterium]
MLRIIAGQFKGLSLAIPKDPLTRPTAAPVREAIFSILGDKTLEARVLDLFAGSGAMGLEALSRGAGSLLLCDQSPLALETLSANLKKVKPRFATKARLLKASFPLDLHSLMREGPFSLILLDPPYTDPVGNVLSILAWMAQNGLASPGATAVWEQSPKSLALWDPEAIKPWQVILSRRWGKKAAAILELPDPNDPLSLPALDLSPPHPGQGRPGTG